MIHTAEFIVILKDKEYNEFRVNDFICLEEGINMKVGEFDLGYRNAKTIHIHVDFLKVLNKSEVIESDIDNILDAIDFELFPILFRRYQLILVRVDYKYDAVIESEAERAMIIELCKRNKTTANYMKLTNRFSCGVRYENKNKVFNIYDKERERKDNNCEILDYEINVLRFEAQIKNPHLDFKKYKYNVKKELQEYMTEEKYKYYMKKMIIETCNIGDYYDRYRYHKIINNSDKKEKVKKELIDFLAFNGRHKNLTLSYQKFGRYKYEKYIDILNELSINPVPIPEKTGFKKIENPLAKLVKKFNIQL